MLLARPHFSLVDASDEYTRQGPKDWSTTCTKNVRLCQEGKNVFHNKQGSDQGSSDLIDQWLTWREMENYPFGGFLRNN